MQPVSFSTVKPAWYPPHYSHSQTDQLHAWPSEDNEEVTCATNSATPMTWKQRGDYHLDRQELDLALESYTQALQKAEREGRTESLSGAA